jgi:hypothetical protein
MMKVKLPGEYMDFAGSRQSTGRLGLRLEFSLLTAVVAISVALLALLFISTFRGSTFRGDVFRGEARLQALSWLCVATVFVNAAISGVLSGPADRYQSRVVWLLPFLLLVVTMPRIGARIARRRPAAPA